MRAFPLFDFQMVVLLFFWGIALFLLFYISFSQFVASSGRKHEEETERFSDEIQMSRNPIPLILVFIYVGFIVWAIFYAIAVGIDGAPF